MPCASTSSAPSLNPAESKTTKELFSKKTSDSIKSRVVPGAPDTKALSYPNNLLKIEDLPEFGGPINKTLFLFNNNDLLEQPLTK